MQLKLTYYYRLISAPAIFPIAYNLAKPFLSDDTKKKIQVLGSEWDYWFKFRSAHFE